MHGKSAEGIRCLGFTIYVTASTIYMRPNNELLRQVIDAAIAAGREIMAVYDDPAFDTQVA